MRPIDQLTREINQWIIHWYHIAAEMIGVHSSFNILEERNACSSLVCDQVTLGEEDEPIFR